MNARTIAPPCAGLAPAVPRPSGRKPSMPRRLVLAELQRHARNGRFTPHSNPDGLSPHTLASAIGVDIKLVRTTLNNMHGAGQIVNAGTHNKPMWRLTTAADMAQQASATPLPVDNGHYDGAELRRTPGIPDERFAAFDLPSLVNGVRVPAKRPSAQLVGALTDRSNNARG